MKHHKKRNNGIINARTDIETHDALRSDDVNTMEKHYWNVKLIPIHNVRETWDIKRNVFENGRNIMRQYRYNRT